MALNIKNAEVDRLARVLAERTGESLTEVVLTALRERMRRLEGRTEPRTLVEELTEIRRRCRELPVVDDRPPEELIGYDEHGLPS